jgi:hypothetical protein
MLPLVSAHAAPSLLPLNVTNNSGRSEQVYLYVLGVNLSTGRLGYVNAAGTFTPWSGGTIPPSPAPDVSIAGPAYGSTKTIQLPLNLSGRMYMSFGEKLKFFLTPDGLVQPAPWNPSDPNRDILFDWSELTYNSAGLWLNSSQVDMFSIPHVVAVTGSTGVTTKAGQPVANGRNQIFDTIAGLSGGWAGLINTRADGTRLRVLAPRLGIESGVFSATYLDSYINQVWTTYQSTTLTVVPFQQQPNLKYLGRVSGTTMNFTDASGAQVASFQKPATKDVFGCDGKLLAPNDQVVGPIARSLCAAFHRSTLGYINTAPTYDASQFYTHPIPDSYSKAMHANMSDGKAYGFAFDDVGGFESLVHDGDPRSASITLAPFGSSTPPPPPDTVTVEAEATGNTLSGTAARRACTGCSSGQKVGSIGNGTANYVTVNNVTVPSAGSYELTVWGLVNGTRSFGVSVNGGTAGTVTFTGTSWATPISRTQTVPLKAGANSIRFFNNTAYAPDLDRIQVRSTGATPPPSPTPSATPSPTPSASSPPPNGSPKQYLLAGGTMSGTAGASGSVTIASAGGANHDGTPANPQVFTASGLTMTHTGGATAFDLFVDSGSAGNGTQVRVSYDLTGDGTYDRVETYQYFATDPVAGYEHYTQAWRGGLLSSSGTLGKLTNGRVRVEVWNAIGGGTSTLGIGNQSVVTLPYA